MRCVGAGLDLLGIFNDADVDGAFVFTFVSPSSPYNEDPKRDFDMTSFSLVKSYAEKETALEIARQTARQGKEILGVDIDSKLLVKLVGDVGRHGASYPDMPWEPKESFRAVANFYASH